MKSGMSTTTGKMITGIPYLRQRIADVLNTPKGSLVGRRAFGSRMYQMIDKNVDQSFYMDVYTILAEALAAPENGLDDFKLDEMSLIKIADSHYQITVSGEYLPEGESIELEGIDLYGCN
jgi:hypothetical protein